MNRRLRLGLTAAFLAGAAIACVVTALSLWPPRYQGPDPVFVGDFESGVLDPEKWHYDGDDDCRLEIVDTPVRAGRHAASFTSPRKGRCEVVPWVGSTILGRLAREPFHQERWYAFSVFLVPPWPDDPQNEVIAQWHDSRDVFFGEKGGRGPPLALRIRDGRWEITFGWDADLRSTGGARAGHRLWSGATEAGRWVDWVFHVRWSHEADGVTRVWKDGELIAEHRGPNAYNDLRGLYLKLGTYHPGVTRTVIVDEVRIGGAGSSRRAVLPDGTEPQNSAPE